MIKGPVSYFEFIDLLAVYLRPEFDDVRRYKVQFFPPEPNLYKGERNDAKDVGDRFPVESAIVTPRELSLDDLAVTSGLHVHYVGLIPHSVSEKADGRVFVGTADFAEHDMSHGYFGFHPALPGTEEEWRTIHEAFRSMQARVGDTQLRIMNSLVYFHLTHESGYKAFLPSEDGVPPTRENFVKEFESIRSRLVEVENFTAVKTPEFFNSMHALH